MSTKKSELSEKELAKNLGDNLESLIDNQELNITDLAAEIGVSFMTLYRILRKDRLPQLLMVAKLADYFGTTIDALLSKKKKN